MINVKDPRKRVFFLFSAAVHRSYQSFVSLIGSRILKRNYRPCSSRQPTN